MFKKIISSFTQFERNIFIVAILVFLISSFFWLALNIQERIDLTPKKGGQYTEGKAGQPTFINPIISGNETDRDIASLIYSPLSDLISDYQIEEGTNYLVKLKQNLLWSDGQPLTSDDIIFTLKTIQDPDARSPLFQTWQGIVTERISELQVRFILRNPYVFFGDNLHNLPIIPQHIFGKIPAANLRLSNYNLEPVGSGPYKYDRFAKRKDGFITQYQLVVNENYSSKKPYIQKFIFKFYKNEDDLISAFNRREIDGFGGLNPAKIKDLSLNHNIKSVVMSNYYAVFFNQNINSNLKNKNIRLALTQVIDKKQIIQKVFNGEAMEAGEPLETTGAPDLTAIMDKKLEFYLIVPQIDFLINTAEIIKEEWAAIGVNLSLIVLNPDDIINQVIRSRDYEMILFGINPANKEDLFSFWHSSQKFYPGLNLAIYGNPKADKLIEEIRQTADPAERQAKLKNLETIIAQDLPAIPLYSPNYLYVSIPDLGGFTDKFLTTASDRFQNVKNWYVETAWVLK
ncbi:MAG: peptide ABC transporter substrate-binding protein [bacterium]|nr:peptide ABC transporter substrate-binding protein [bacterium]